jgi:hypothetical protein
MTVHLLASNLPHCPTMSAESASSSSVPDTHLLPAPPSDGDTTTIEVGGRAISLDKLGPMIVNSDGVRPGFYFGR